MTPRIGGHPSCPICGAYGCERDHDAGRGILNDRDYAETRREVRRAMGLDPWPFTPWELRQVAEEGRRWSEEFSRRVKAMTTLTPEDLATRCR